ncbi:bifunctional homocysteine S-methyltransferase/methylenetetrahydrofolate reductase [Bacillus litorisediminis]|uniref:bifunctional homocysteine S-methyltransferase/methylenetetrahydrofolate reductase n=1 Tax=Bacillus litorisediminis TaxID=2922713 RepID=UPI001FACC54A|nr:bifunctional homocysteine S-methyltransferase/methylenetetrahydrofolate reductase [Bacillus litorisediminis]
MSLLEDLKSKVLIADGAMGTLLYSHGIDRCIDELNISKPDEVLKVHQAYLKAGAQVIQTNTYGANYQKLARYGLEDQVKEINQAAVRIANEATNLNPNAYVLGTIGGIRGIKKSVASLGEIKRSFREQLFWLLQSEVDGILLETYYDFEEICTVLQIARHETNIPIIAQVSLHEVGYLQNGMELSDALFQLEQFGADVVGMNCRLGPHHTIRSLETVPLPQKAFLSAYPNASLPQYVDGEYTYGGDDDYFEKSALALYKEGVRLIGGCCGTTPRHIAAFARAVKDKEPVVEKVLPERKVQVQLKSSGSSAKHVYKKAKTTRSIIVELDPPRHLDTTVFFAGAKALKEAGIDALTMADNSLATPRISNIALASRIKNDIGIPPLVHIACRDRNLIGIESHLMGLHSLGITDLLAVTGDPAKIGDFPGASSVYDLNSFDLIKLIKQFNEGLSSSGKQLKGKTDFSVAGAFNPNVRNLDRAVQRLEKKLAAGADYFISQPVYSEEKMVEIYESVKGLDVPIYIGVMPLTGARNAEFLHNEVPGITLSEQILTRMSACGTDKLKATQEGMAIAKHLIDAAFDLFNGIYLITPFLRYELTVELTKYIHEKEALRKERKVFNG